MAHIRVLCPMLTCLSASTIYPVSQPPIANGVLAVDEAGYVRGLYQPEQAISLNLPIKNHYAGALLPGFINTHCHLELSHLRGQIPQHTGLFEFVSRIMKNRAAQPSEIIKAMADADEEMYQNGIVAVGDISNQPISAATKLNSKIYYHTFVEAMGFNPAQAASIISSAQEILESFKPLKASIVPHAPYSVSDPLFAAISALAESQQENLISMHNQETAAEDAFFESKTGAFLELYKMLGLNLDAFKPSGKSSLQTTLPKLPKTKSLLVHNTQTTKADADFANSHHPDLYWCLCPNANLYIENTLPDVAMLSAANLKITLGTDSLASNHQLSILDEMQVLQKHKHIGFQDLLRWATLNGAKFLGIDDTFGTFEIGKQPGILLLEQFDNEQLTGASRIKRLF
jgi:cytosine/adenosine deaminase-related metal-dependent hydrolase